MKLKKDNNGNLYIGIGKTYYELWPVSFTCPQSFNVYVGDDLITQLEMMRGCLVARIYPGMERVYESSKPKGVDSLLPGERDRFLTKAIESVHSYRKHKGEVQ